MRKFIVRITETLEKDVEVEAETIGAALDIAEKKYDAADEDFILTDEVTEHFFSVVGEKEDD